MLNAPVKWYDKPVMDSYIRPAMESVGGPGKAGMYAALLTFPLWATIANRRGLPNANARAGIVSAGIGALTYKGTQPKDKSIKQTPKMWANMFLPKTAAEMMSTPFNKSVLFQAVDDIDGLNNSQRIFLSDGISNATTANSKVLTTLEGLADGFADSVGSVTGSKLSYVTRAIEGAVIGSAFSHLAGLSPRASKWTMGVAAVADSLYGNRLINTIGELY